MADVFRNAPQPTIPPQLMKRIQKELTNCYANIKYFKYDETGEYGEINSFYIGFIGTGYYENQQHILRGKFINAAGDRIFPKSAPTIYFVTPILHSNVSLSGTICLDTLNTAWTPMMTIENVMQSILMLLVDPNEKSPMNSAVAKIKDLKSASIADYNSRIKNVSNKMMKYVFGDDFIEKESVDVKK